MRKTRVVAVMAVAALAAVTVAVAPRGGPLELSWYTVDGGGDMFSAGGDLELSGTIGQTDAGVMSGGDLTLTGGFWFGHPPGDCNATGDVTLFDHQDFVACMGGPTGPPLPPTCRCFDMDGDGDADVTDFALLQASFMTP